MAGSLQKIVKPTKYRAVDTSGNNNHGKIYSGRALQFDGVSDRFATTGGGTVPVAGTGIEGVNKFSDGESWTMAVWIYLNGQQDCFVIGKDQATRPHLVLNLDSSVQYLEFRAEDLGNDTYRFGKLQENTWHRLVITSNGTSLSAYSNGALIGTIADGAASIDSSGSFSSTEMWFTGWGGSYESSGIYAVSLDGMMSDAQVWNVEWSASDIEFDYLNPESLVLNNSGTSLTESNLKLWYPMQDGNSGQVSYNSQYYRIMDGANLGLSSEMLTNTDFESGISGWSAKQCTLLHTSKQNIISGSGSLKVTSLANADAGPYQNIGAYAGVTYKVSGTMQLLTGSSNGTIKIINSTSTGSSQDTLYSGESGGLISGGDAVSFTAYVVALDSQPSIQFACNVADGSFVLDDVSVKAVNDKHHGITVFTGSEVAVNGDMETFPTLHATNDDTFTDESVDGSQQVTMVTEGTIKNSGSKSAKCTLASGETTGYITYNKTDYVVGKTYRAQVFMRAGGSQTISAFQMFADDSIRGEDGTDGTAITPDEDFAMAYVEFIASATTMMINMKFTGTATHFAFIDDFSIKEVGVSSGWSRADQQLDIPQTALQSYNQKLVFGDTSTTCDFGTTAETNMANINDGKTISFWINPFEFNNGMILGTNIAQSRIVAYSSTVIQMEDDANAVTLAWTVPEMVLGSLYHIVIVFNDNAGYSLYMNGEFISTQDDDAFSGIDIDAIGGKSSGGSDNFNGIIDEISFWGAELTAAQVVEIFNDGVVFDLTDSSSYTNLSYSDLTYYWRNNGLSVWPELKAGASNTEVTPSVTNNEIMMLSAGTDSSKDIQGFPMNKQRDTNSLNLTYTGASDGYVDLVEETTRASTSAFSITLWVKPSHVGDNRFIGSGADYIRFKTSSQIRISANGSVFNISLSSGSWNVNEWIHMGIVRDASDDVTMYVDGASQDTVAIAQPFDYRYIGAYDAADTFDGDIDDVCIYHDELSAAEVLRNYNAGKRSHK